MSINATDLYADGPAAGAKAKILLIHFDGAIDAGAAGRMAIRQLLRSLHNERVATFDADTLMDYRSHRPIVTVDNWVSSPDMVMPQTVLDLVEDDMGNPILVLHGAEPDAHWESFTAAIRDICERAGVEITFSLHGVPSGVPHTRPTPVHVQATDESLLPSGSNAISNHMQFPSPLSTFMQIRMGQQGIGGLALLGASNRGPRRTRRTSPSSWRETPTSLARSPTSRSTSTRGPVGRERSRCPDSVSVHRRAPRRRPRRISVTSLRPTSRRSLAPRMKKSSPSSARRAPKRSRNPPSPTPSKMFSLASRHAAGERVPVLPLRVTAPKRAASAAG